MSHVPMIYQNPTPVYVVDGSDSVLQCGFESSNLNWDVYYGVGWDNIAYRSDIIDNSKYLTFMHQILHFNILTHTIIINIFNMQVVSIVPVMYPILPQYM